MPRNANDAAPVDFLLANQSAVIRIFPNGQLGAGGAPRIHDLFVGPISLGDPFQKIEDQGLYNRVH